MRITYIIIYNYLFNMDRIFLIEDDFWISNSLKIYLENSWYFVEVLDTWESAVNSILNNQYDLIILDINLPVVNWIEICEKVREKSSIPIIMLTARNNETDKIKLLTIWADDYISKPFSPRELLARVQTILRRTNSLKNNLSSVNNIDSSNDWIINFRDISIDTKKYKVTKGGVDIPFTKNEFDILLKIVTENWNLVTRETLMVDIIWYNQYVYDRTIDTHIKNIRKKLNNKDMIITIRWEWYRLNI